MPLFSIFGLYWMFTCDHLCMKGSITIVFDTKRFPCRHHKWHHGCWHPKFHQIMLVILWYWCQIIAANQTYIFERSLLNLPWMFWTYSPVNEASWPQSPGQTNSNGSTSHFGSPYANAPLWLYKADMYHNIQYIGRKDRQPNTAAILQHIVALKYRA